MGTNRLRLILFLALYAVFLMASGRIFNSTTGSSSKDTASMREMLGTFTDLKGKQANSIWFELVPDPIKTNGVLGTVQARRGKGHLHRMFGYEDMDFIWGYSEPLPLEQPKPTNLYNIFPNQAAVSVNRTKEAQYPFSP